MVARILLESHGFQRFLSRNFSYMHTAKHTTILLKLLEFVIGILCLGIPHLFVDRARYTSHFDVENNAAVPSSAPPFNIGVCANLVSAITLSASVTLMSLSGLGSIAQIGSLIARSCSVASMAISFKSIFQHKSNMPLVADDPVLS